MPGAPSARKRGTADYRRSDVEVLSRGGTWRSWDDAIHWLEESGEADSELTLGEVRAMREDVMSLRGMDFKFTHKPDELYEMAHEHRHRQTRPACS